MLKSMTAYARAENRSDDYETVSEIRSYNSKHLDVVVHLQRAYLPLEDRIKTAVAAQIHRGRIDLRIEIRDLREDHQAFDIDWPRAAAYHDALSRMQKELNLPGSPTLELLIGAGGMIKPAENVHDMDTLWPVVDGCLREALSALNHMRQREGDALAADFRQRLDDIEQQLQWIAKDSDGLLEAYQDRLLERVRVLTRGNVDIDPGRVAQEAAFLADRSDISEEIVRVASHLEHFRHIMDNEEPAGRKLNFLLQEFNREFNTMGSKTSRTDIAHRVVALKSELEKIREQVQNIE
jgi:uncharacterized protein (TIGR00255 family)